MLKRAHSLPGIRFSDIYAVIHTIQAWIHLQPSFRKGHQRAFNVEKMRCPG
ncbi:hypothetical protein AVEN_111778-1, partial [Araneus ventricosus]